MMERIPNSIKNKRIYGSIEESDNSPRLRPSWNQSTVLRSVRVKQKPKNEDIETEKQNKSERTSIDSNR